MKDEILSFRDTPWVEDKRSRCEYACIARSDTHRLSVCKLAF